ncbi:MAG: ExbD/TolR family protein [Planctomycetota bacterium]
MARRHDEMEHKNELNMTPMIDVVFLLLIFFMVVSELSALDAEAMTLPWAEKAEPPEKTAARIDIVVVNVLKPKFADAEEPGEIRVRGKKYDKRTLKEYLRQAAQEVPLEDTRKRISSLKVLIRADMECRYEAVQVVFDSCQQNGIYKTELAGSKAYVRPPAQR